MLFMVVECFKNGQTDAIGERFERNGRMLPADVVYHASWMDVAGVRCFQIMEAPHRESIDDWVRCWDDLVDFEIIPVLTSAEFWTQRQGR